MPPRFLTPPPRPPGNRDCTRGSSNHRNRKGAELAFRAPGSLPRMRLSVFDETCNFSGLVSIWACRYLVCGSHTAFSEQGPYGSLLQVHEVGSIIWCYHHFTYRKDKHRSVKAQGHSVEGSWKNRSTFTAVDDQSPSSYAFICSQECVNHCVVVVVVGVFFSFFFLSEK